MKRRQFLTGATGLVGLGVLSSPWTGPAATSFAADVGGAVAHTVETLARGRVDAAIEGWTPEPGTWPLEAYGPANTRANPHATPPESVPSVRTVTVGEGDSSVRPRIVVGPDHVVRTGDRLHVFEASGSPAGTLDRAVAHAGFGPPDDRLLAVVDTSAGAQLLQVDPTRPADATTIETIDGLGVTDLLVGQSEVYVAIGTAPSSGEVVALGDDRWSVPGLGAAIADGQLFATQPRSLLAFEDRTGPGRPLFPGPRRVFDSEAPRGTPGPAVADELVVTTRYGRSSAAWTKLAAVEAGSGTERWKQIFESDISDVAFDGNFIYHLQSSPEGSRLHAIEAATGEDRWQQALPTEYGFRAPLGVPPVVGGDTVIAACNGYVWAGDAATGEERWRVSVDGPTHLAVAGDRVYVAALSGLVVIED